MTLSVKDASGTTQTIKTNDDMAGSAGTPNANVLSVQGIVSGTPQPISAASLPLPAGAATDASLGTIGTTPPTLPGASTGIMGLLRWIGSLYASLIATATGNAYRVVLVDPASGNGSLVQAFHNADNQAVSNTSYGLLTGGVDQLINAAGNLDRKRAVTGDAMPATGLAVEVPMFWNGTSYDRGVNGAGTAAKAMRVVVASDQASVPVSVANFPASQPVSGSVAVSNLPATQAVSAASLPLPTGAATAALQPALNADGGAQVHVQNFPATQLVSGTFFQATQPVSGSVSVGNFPATQPVSATVLPLPAGASTAALQPAINADGGAQVHVQNFPATQPVSVAAAIPAFRPGTPYTARSGTITAGGTAQTLSASNANRRGYRVMNLSTADLWINDEGIVAVAGQPSFKVAAGALYESPGFGVSTAAISIFGATTAQAFQASEA